MIDCLTYRAHTAQEMRDLGALVAQKALKLGDKSILLLLSGTLGAGKTTFSQGFFKALGVKERVISPTYGILHLYSSDSSITFYHMDMYRVSSISDFEELGVEEILSSSEPFIFVVEWASKFPEIWEDLGRINILHLSLEIGRDEVRSLVVEGL